MSQNDTEIESSEEQEPQNETARERNETGKLVDVSEAIRYRKRAQVAEQKKSLLEEAIAEKSAEVERLNKHLSEMTVERQLIEKFVSAGVKDLDAALIIGKSRIGNDSKVNVNDVVEQLKREKGYLFNEAQRAAAIAKTSGVKDRLSGTRSTLERTATRAAKSGSRTDLQEYLRVRRSVI